MKDYSIEYNNTNTAIVAFLNNKGWTINGKSFWDFELAVKEAMKEGYTYFMQITHQPYFPESCEDYLNNEEEE